jgi:aminoglycoside 3-N-acetyltransferase
LDARVLLLGTEYDACTAMHLAEARLQGARRERNGVPAIDEAGQRVWREYEDVKYDADLFLWIGHDFEKRSEDRPRIGFVGSASARLVRMRPLVDHALAWLEKRRDLA